jgi:hypothetical protein
VGLEPRGYTAGYTIVGVDRVPRLLHQLAHSKGGSKLLRGTFVVIDSSAGMSPSVVSELPCIPARVHSGSYASGAGGFV